MSKKEKPNIKKLEYPLWFNITFYCLTILVPIVSIMTQGFQSHNTMFKISFGLVASSLLLWSFIHKFLISNIETTMRTRKVALEHDYEDFEIMLEHNGERECADCFDVDEKHKEIMLY